ncbi:MAG TPA: hypothetical protein VIU12_33785 [Chryseolinea sp.]
MRTSLNDIRLAEKHIQKTLEPSESLVFQARLITEPVLRWDVYLLRKVCDVLALRQRKGVKTEMEAIHTRLFTHPAKADFQKQIFQLFKS